MPINMEKLKNQLSRDSFSSEKDDITWYHFPSGIEQAIIRFLPPWAGYDLPGIIYSKHYSLPGKPSIKNCLKNWKMDCPLCKVIDKYKDKSEQLVSQNKAGHRAYFNVLVKSDPTIKIDPNTPVILDAPVSIYYWLANQITDPIIGDITDPEQGTDVGFKREKSGGKFIKTIARGSSKIADNPVLSQQIIEKIFDITKLFPQPKETDLASYEAIAHDLDLLLAEKLKNMAYTNPPSNTTTPFVPTQTGSDKPHCFGNPNIYNPSTAQCIACKHEVHCSKEINNDDVPF